MNLLFSLLKISIYPFIFKINRPIVQTVCNILYINNIKLDDVLKKLDEWTHGRNFQFGRSLDDLFCYISPN